MPMRSAVSKSIDIKGMDKKLFRAFLFNYLSLQTDLAYVERTPDEVRALIEAGTDECARIVASIDLSGDTMDVESFDRHFEDSRNDGYHTRMAIALMQVDDDFYV